MGHNRATFDAYDKVVVRLPRREQPVELECLTVREGVRFYRLLLMAQGVHPELPPGDPERGAAMAAAHTQILEEFPAAVGLEDAKLTVAEVFQVLDRFCSHQGTPGLTQPTTGTEAATPLVGTSTTASTS